MHYIVLIEHFEGVKQLFEVGEGLWLWELHLTFKKVIEGASIAVFVDEVEVISCPKHLNELDDVGGRRTDCRQCLDFIECAFL